MTQTEELYALIHVIFSDTNIQVNSHKYYLSIGLFEFRLCVGGVILCMLCVELCVMLLRPLV